MKEAHDSTSAGHPSVKRMLALLSRVYFWPKMEDDIDAYVNTCYVCQVEKTERKKEDRFYKPYLFHKGIGCRQACNLFMGFLR